MSNYIFHGVVLPERANVHIGKAKCSYPKIELILECYCSKLTVACSSDSDVDILTLKNYVEMAVRNITDSLGYTIACGYDVEIESAYNLNTFDMTVFGVHENIFDDAKVNEDTSKGNTHPDIRISPFKLAKISGENTDLQIAYRIFEKRFANQILLLFTAIEQLKH